MLYCSRCGKQIDVIRIRCPACGGVVHVQHGFTWLIDDSKKGLWKMASMLPRIPIENSLCEGFTPIVKAVKVSKLLGVEKLYFKDEGRNPTGSFRDRVAAILTSHAKSIGARVLVCATDGNAGASLAAYAARLGLKVKAYVPREADYTKIVLMKGLGAEVYQYGDKLDDVYNYVSKIVGESRGYYNATSEDNPLSIEALKTIAFEIFMDMGDRVDAIILPVGSGLTLYSIYYGYSELVKYGIAKRIPKLIGVQICSNPSIALRLGKGVRCSEKPIIGLAYDNPPLGDEVIKAIKDTRGDMVVVSRRDTIEAGEMLARYEGLFVEPAAAVTMAGLVKALREGSVARDERIVILLTGHGLKGYEPYTEPQARRRVVRAFPKDTKMEIIRLLGEREGLHGYSIWKELGLNISFQAVYQHLNDLERRGFIYSKTVDGRRYYYLTSKGRRVVELLNELYMLLSI